MYFALIAAVVPDIFNPFCVINDGHLTIYKLFRQRPPIIYSLLKSQDPLC